MNLRLTIALLYLSVPLALAACGPVAAIPPVPQTIPGLVGSEEPPAALAHKLAPLLYLQSEEPFHLERVVAVIHPYRPIIAYRLLWEDDAHGSWIPFTVPTDEEAVWVGYDSAGNPTDVWTYWHGAVVHADWKGRGRPEINVQWGKHGTFPRGTTKLPRGRSLRSYYLYSWFLPDLWLGRATRDGPLCFCGGFERYSEFSRPLDLAPRLDAVIRAGDPSPALRAIFGESYSDKMWWPDPEASYPTSIPPLATPPEAPVIQLPDTP
jgi:hypothetical protein